MTHEERESRIADLTHEIRSNEQIFYPAKWVYFVLMSIPLLVVLFLLIGALDSFEQLRSFGGFLEYMLFMLPCLFILFHLGKRFDRKLFTTRLNACGFMSLHNGERVWYSWSEVDDIKAVYSSNSSGNEYISGIKILSKINDAYYQDLPSNYSIPDEKMIFLMKKYNREYTRLDIDQYPEIEKILSKDPVEMYMKKGWGRSRNRA